MRLAVNGRLSHLQHLNCYGKISYETGGWLIEDDCSCPRRGLETISNFYCCRFESHPRMRRGLETTSNFHCYRYGIMLPETIVYRVLRIPAIVDIPYCIDAYVGLGLL